MAIYHVLKLFLCDQSFVCDLLEHPKENLLVMAILEIGNILGLKVVAEGIETEKQLQHLSKLNCRIGQGYFFSKPIKASELENQFLKNTSSDKIHSYHLG